MSCRTLSAGLSAAVLLGLAGLALAKPPDLPLDQKDTVTPKTATQEEEIQLEPPMPNEGYGHRRDSLEPLRERVRAGRDSSNEGAKAIRGGCLSDTPPGSHPCHSESDAVRVRFAAWLETLPPSVRRRATSNLLVGIHPLLWFIHPDKLVDFPCDHPVPRTAGVEEDDLPISGSGLKTTSPPFGINASRESRAVEKESPCATHTLTGSLIADGEAGGTGEPGETGSEFCFEINTSSRGLRWLFRYLVAGLVVQVRWDCGEFTVGVTPPPSAASAADTEAGRH